MSTQKSQAAVSNAPLAQLGYTLYAEVIRTLRIPALLVPSLVFPTLFFLLFGLTNAKYTISGVSGATYLMVSYGCYAAMSTSFLSFGITTATERGMGWNKLLRASAVNPVFVFIARFISIVLVVILSLIVLFIVSIVLGKVSLPAGTWLSMTGTVILGMVPFVALGLALGYLAGPNSAPSIANLIFIPLAFFSGILIPVSVLPDFAKNFAPYTPSYHAGQLAWHSIGAGDSTAVGIHLLWIGGYTAIFVALALLAYRREERRTFG